MCEGLGCIGGGHGYRCGWGEGGVGGIIFYTGVT